MPPPRAGRRRSAVEARRRPPLISVARWWSGSPQLRLDRLPAPLLGGDVGGGLGEGPVVAADVPGAVLALAVRHVSRLHQDRRPMRPGPFAMGAGILDPDHHRVRNRHRVGIRRTTMAVFVTDDHGTVAEPELGPVVLADADPFHEPERLVEPRD